MSRLCIQLASLAVAVLTAQTAETRHSRTVIFQAINQGTGEPFSELKAQDVEIVEGNHVYPAQSLRFGISPLDIVLVLDLRWDMVETSRNLVQGARLACYELDPGDRIALVTFASGPKVRFEFLRKGDAPARQIERAVASSAWSGPVKMYDAIQAAGDLFPAVSDPSRRRVIAIVTNHLDEGSLATPESILRAARDKNIAIFGTSIARMTVNISGLLQPPLKPAQTAESHLKPLAEATGGEFRLAGMSGYLLRQTFERIRNRYLATYETESAQPPRATVRLSSRGAIAFPDVRIQAAP